jgi:hypothetical protein
VSLSAHPGSDRVHFYGRVSAARGLAPGRYTVSLTATNGAGQSATAGSLAFTIVK